MKNQNLILLLVLAFAIVSEAKLKRDEKFERSTAGGWSTYSINSNYKSDTSQPLSIVHKNLSEMLEKQQISNINFYNVQSQIVNGMNFKVDFSYEQDSILKHGSATVYVQTWTDTFNVVSLNLEKKEANNGAMTGGWNNYQIEQGYQSNPQSPLYQAHQEISKVLKEKNIELVKFDKVSSQIVSGINLQVTFTYKQNGEEKQGQCKVYLRPWEKVAEVSNLQIDAQQEEEGDQDIKVEVLRGVQLDENNDFISDESRESRGRAGGFYKYDYEADFQTNSSNPLHTAFKELNNKLSSNDLEFIKIVKVDKQIVNGTNYRITFVSSNSNGKQTTGECVIYVPFTGKAQVTKFNSNH